ncbi:aldo/keto reductase [Nocardia macrotermitis]|uniref:Pyridoxine 4-dehydrogenase n=1 Tax=Nocardia macrotermitis TaxID=2585198 RepID=A0A7K0D145_9NOCA|nr:aldo/keto reductase [Nocardia macrotermitis]MQY19449.1 Pyridoxine 4-dehydrogenase [Nocardia macrotermitis]
MAVRQEFSAPGGTAALGPRTVARIGYGAMQLTDHDGRDYDRQAGIDILREAVEQGVNHIDTAQFYGAGAVNELIREALSPYPADLVLATKVGAVHDPEVRLRAAQQPKQLRAQVEANLVALGTDSLGVVNMRRADAPPGIIAEGDQVVDLDDQLAELIALRDEGKIEAIGLSHISADQLRQALPAEIACVQNLHSLLNRENEPVLDLCRAHDIAWVPYFPLGSAFPAFSKVTEHPEVLSAATTLNTTPAQIGLAWQLAHYTHTLLIPGTSNPAHLAENLATGSVQLPADIMKTLDDLARAAG